MQNTNSKYTSRNIKLYLDCFFPGDVTQVCVSVVTRHYQCVHFPVYSCWLCCIHCRLQGRCKGGEEQVQFCQRNWVYKNFLHDAVSVGSEMRIQIQMLLTIARHTSVVLNASYGGYTKQVCNNTQ